MLIELPWSVATTCSHADKVSDPEDRRENTGGWAGEGFREGQPCAIFADPPPPWRCHTPPFHQ